VETPKENFQREGMRKTKQLQKLPGAGDSRDKKKRGNEDPGLRNTPGFTKPEWDKYGKKKSANEMNFR